MTERRVTFSREQIAAYATLRATATPSTWMTSSARSVVLPRLIAHGMLQMGIAATVAAEAAGGPASLRRLSVRLPAWWYPATW